MPDATTPTQSQRGERPIVNTDGDDAAFARGVLAAEAGAIANIEIDDAFGRAMELVLSRVAPVESDAAGGSLVVGGLGKSGLIGQKLSATFASTGTPSHFLHPAEAMHGDLGRIRRGDVVLLLSYSGATEEVIALAAILRQDGVPTIAITSGRDCDLARLCTVSLAVGDVTEACPLNLAPTASTTAMLALGDALALAVSRRRSFDATQFRRVHPGGGLGRQLMRLDEAMRFRVGHNMQTISPETTIEAAYRQAEQFAPGSRRAGALLIVDENGKLAGIFTDGDLRRALIQHGRAPWGGPISDHMTSSPKSLPADGLVRDAVQMVRELRIDEIPVLDDSGRPVGLIDVQDLMALKVIQ